MSRRFRGLVPSAAPLAAALLACAAARAAEPSYGLTLPGGAVHAVLEITEAPGGGRIVRVRATPAAGGGAQAAFALSLDAAGRAARCRVDASSPLGAIVLEAARGAAGMTVRIPEQEGTLAVAAPVVSSLDALAFLGKRYDWTKGGKQPFALLVDFGPLPIQLITMTLEAAGTEKLSLEGGDVTARKLKADVELPNPPKGTKPGGFYFYTGPRGEVLTVDLPVPGLTLKASKPATAEGGSLVMRLAQPAHILLKTTRTAAGYEAKLATESGFALGSAVTDTAYRPVRLENIFHGRAFTATIAPAQLRWRLAGSDPQAAPLTGDPWFFPCYFVTDLWEKGEKSAPLPVGEKRQATYFALELGIQTGTRFTAERLQDTVLPRADGGSMALHHWRLTYPTNVYDLWTDGMRLVKLAGSDKFTITRDGWENAASSLKAPAAPTPPGPASPP